MAAAAGAQTMRLEEMRFVGAGAVTFGVIHREFTLESMAPYQHRPGVQEIIDRINNEGFFDQGVSIYVFAAGTKNDYLRFDCFEVEPHYHYHHLYALMVAGEAIDMQYQKLAGHADSISMNGYWHQVPFDSAANGDIRSWALDRLRTRLPQMLAEAGQPGLGDDVDMDLVRTALDEVETLVYASIDRTQPAATHSH
jgi:hypothetical protein